MKEIKKMNCLELAVYGKGGIGKSTVSANLSAALALAGRKVLQIGCDPKHDSTRLLMHGETLPTILDYLKTVDSGQESPEFVLREGFQGIGCMEAGGPRPGVGCAGRGIISAFEFLERKKVKQRYDLVVYDVLGDVVCGGFAVPVRREYADAIYLVTSGEFMALYAANNILRGIRSFDGDTYCRVAGIIYNERRLAGEDERVARFARAVGLPICAKVPRSEAFALAEQQNRTVMELEGCKQEQKVFQNLAEQIRSGLTLYPALPLTDEELERVVLQPEKNADAACADMSKCKNVEVIPETEPGAKCDAGWENHGSEQKKAEQENQGTEAENSRGNRPPLYGCAFNGAATAAVNLTDALILAHAPRACAFYTWQNISSPGRKNLFTRGILMPSAITPHFACTGMEQTDVVFGGMDRLRLAVETAIAKKPGAVVIISSCVSGIIGDDIRQMEALSAPELPVITIPADGDMAGDYMEGIRMCMHILAEHLIDPKVQPDRKAINVVGETGVATNRETNYRILKTWMDAMGIQVNCRYLGETNCEALRGFLKAPLNVLAADNAEGRELREWLTAKYNCNFLDEPLPAGFTATKQWLLKVGHYFECADRAERLIAGQEQHYRQRVQALRSVLGGKRMLMMTINTNVDWLLDVLAETGVEILWIGVLNYLNQPVKITDYPERYRIDSDFKGERIQELIESTHPDIVISNYVDQSENGAYVTDSMPMIPEIGFYAGVQIAERWAGLLGTARRGGWMNDRALFEKYYS